MRNFQKKGKFRKIMQSKFFLIFLGILIVIFSYSMFSFMNKMNETSKNRKIIEEKILELKQSKEKLNSDISKLKTEEGIEESIRDKFGLGKEGENMIMIIEDNKTSEDEGQDNSGFFDFLKNWFK